jgi:putative modified peptide
MDNGKLTRDEAIALLTKLSSDDAFRTQFEKDPAGALQGIGIGTGDVAALPPSAAAPEPLPSKEQFQQALTEVKEAGVSYHICLIFPLLKLTYGDNKP